MEFYKTEKKAGEWGLSGKYDKQSIGWKGALEGEMGKWLWLWSLVTKGNTAAIY